VCRPVGLAIQLLKGGSVITITYQVLESFSVGEGQRGRGQRGRGGGRGAEGQRGRGAGGQRAEGRGAEGRDATIHLFVNEWS